MVRPARETDTRPGPQTAAPAEVGPTPDVLHAEPVNPRRALLAGLGGLAAGAFLASTANAGPLAPPPGPIASTPSPEPRIPLTQATAPGDETSVFRITQPGSYYLTADLVAPSGKGGILLATSNVSLDLMGFSVIGTPSLQRGIATASGGTRQNYTIRNGTVTGWGDGGINLIVGSSSTANCLIEDVRALFNTNAGIRVGSSAIVRGCVVSNNAGSGILTGANSIVAGCTVRQNAGAAISAGDRCIIRDCTAGDNALPGLGGIIARENSLISNCTSYRNGSPGNSAIGVFSGTIEGCTAFENLGSGIRALTGTVTGCFSRGNSGDGISVTEGSTVSNCSAFGNVQSGIRASRDSQILQNNCQGNGLGSGGTAGAGIHVTGNRCQVEHNNSIGNGRGYLIDGTANYIARNTASGNTLNWSVANANVCQVVLAAPATEFSGNSGGVNPGSSNPNTNYTY